LVYDNLLSNAYKYEPNLVGDYFSLYKGGSVVDMEDPRYGPRLRLPLCEGYDYNVLFYYIDDVTQNERPPGGYDSFSSFVMGQVRTRVLASGAASADWAFGGVFSIIIDSFKDLFGTSWEPDCRKPNTNICVLPGTILEVMEENGQVEFIHNARFRLSGSSEMANQNADVFTSAQVSDLCYADYRVDIGTELNYGERYIRNAAEIDKRYTESVDEWLFGVVNEDRDGDGKPDGGVTATITDPNSWIDNFFTIFNPFDLRPPVGLVRDADGNIVFSFEAFFYEMMGILFSNPIYFIVVMFKILLFYVAKYMFWVLAYALLSYLWTRAMPNISVYWLIIFFLFIAIIILGWWSSYSDFVDMFKVM